MPRELQRSGYGAIGKRVDTAEAMDKALQTGVYDLVLADHNMPHFNALDALQVLKTSGLGLPFIIVSGAIGEDAAVAAMRAGAYDYVMKNNPFAPWRRGPAGAG